MSLGFALGIYALPILIAPAAPSAQAVKAATAGAAWSGSFRRDLKDSDALHWGEGTVRVSARNIALEGRLAPGPDYNFVVPVPESVDPTQYKAVIVWCERFSQFITAATYR